MCFQVRALGAGRHERSRNTFGPTTAEFKLTVELQPPRSSAGMCWYLIRALRSLCSALQGC